MISKARFKKRIKDYYQANRRKMPWRETHDPYRILVSEIMLQQTQVARVIGFYEKFIKQFPDFKVLARAKTEDVLRAWQGLGYNRRALALQKLAHKVVEKHGGHLPNDIKGLIALPGIGKYTAGAIRTFAFNEPEIFIETNIRRVFIHFFFPVGKITGEKRGRMVTDASLVRYIEGTIDRKSPREWYYALMDYGAMLGGVSRRGERSAKTPQNPNRRSAHYVRQSAFIGSDRELRGKVLRILLAKKKLSRSALVRSLGGGEPQERISKIILGLTKDGFIMKNGNYLQLAK